MVTNKRQSDDFKENFSFLAMLKSIKILLAILHNHTIEFGKRMSKPYFLFEILKGCVLDTKLKVFTFKRMLNVCKMQKFKYDLSKH